MSKIIDFYKENTDFIFSEAVKTIDFGLNRNCNRASRCPWCPNNNINKKSDEMIISDENLVSALINLKAAGFDGNFSLNRYNEPFLLNTLSEKVAIIQQHFPNSVISCNTNTELLTRDMLEKVCKAGMSTLRMQIYPDNQNEIDNFSEDWVLPKLMKISERLGLKATQTDILDGYYYEYIFEAPEDWGYGGKQPKLIIYAKNLSKLGCSRGDTVKSLSAEPRLEGCGQIGKFLAIDPDGSVSYCTNLTGKMLGIKKHEDMIIGNIFDEDILDIYSRIVSHAKIVSAPFTKESQKLYPLCVTCGFMPHVSQINKLKASL